MILKMDKRKVLSFIINIGSIKERLHECLLKMGHTVIPHIHTFFFNQTRYTYLSQSTVKIINK